MSVKVLRNSRGKRWTVSRYLTIQFKHQLMNENVYLKAKIVFKISNLHKLKIQ